MDHPSKATQVVSPSGAASPPGDLTGRVLGDFRVLRALGQGGMGRVYLAEQISLRRKVALKLLRPDLAANRPALERFKAEALAVARATHANIVQVYAIGESDGLHFMALEYVDGRNLREHLEKKGPPDVPQALAIMRQAAAALQRAGELGIVHRDIKPENILLTRAGEVKVADFGLSRCLEGNGEPLRLTQSGVTLGTPLYMSPEQVQGQPLDARTDIYSLGVTCYHMLAGHPPFRGDSPFDVALQHVNTPPEPLGTVRPDLPPELCAVVHKMMAKQPEHRYQTGRDLLKDLARLRGRLALPGGPTPTEALSFDSAPVPATAAAAPAPAPRRRRLLPVVALTLLAAAAVGGAAGLLWRQHRAATAAPAPAADDSTSAPEPFQSLARREQFLKEGVERYAKPQDPSDVRTGLGLCQELGVFYLQQGRLAEADQFFNHLIAKAPEVQAYGFLGRLGHAIVLGLQDRPGESDDLFLKVLFDPRTGAERPQAFQFLRANPRLHEWVAAALDANAINQARDHTFPSKLEPLRHPFGAQPPRAAADKPSGKRP
jgi:serine/threonine-protein kinase